MRLKATRNPKDPNDTSKPGGAGLHPSEVQFGIWAAKVSGGVEKLCADLLRPNRIGLMLYNLSPSASEAKTFLINCQKWNQALNASEELTVIRSPRHPLRLLGLPHPST